MMNAAAAVILSFAVFVPQVLLSRTVHQVHRYPWTVSQRTVFCILPWNADRLVGAIKHRHRLLSVYSWRRWLVIHFCIELTENFNSPAYQMLRFCNNIETEVD